MRVPDAYRRLLARPQVRLLLASLGVSSLGDGISTVTITWLAVGIAPAGSLGLFVGPAVAAYTLPGGLPAVLAARSAIVMLATPLGTAIGGPIVGLLGGAGTLAWSGVATVLLAAAGALVWRERGDKENENVPGQSRDQRAARSTSSTTGHQCE